MAKDAKKRPYYVDNKKFFAAMCEFKTSVNEAKDAGQSRPVVPNYVAECIMKIATHLSYKPNFINYTFRDEMISDGIENSLQYIDNFNPEKSKNPFAYFTQIIYYAFLRRIQKEKKHLYVKMKVSDHLNVLGDTADTQGHDSGRNFNDDVKFSEWTQEYMKGFVQDFEENKRRKVKKRRTVEEK
jgi:hypothetical protein